MTTMPVHLGNKSLFDRLYGATMIRIIFIQLNSCFKTPTIQRVIYSSRFSLNMLRIMTYIKGINTSTSTVPKITPPKTLTPIS